MLPDARRRIILAGALLAFATLAPAQTPPKKTPRVGFCGGFGDRTHAFHKAFVEGMRKRGWIDGTNVQILIPEGTIVPPGIVLKSCDDYMADKDLDVIVDGGRPETRATRCRWSGRAGVSWGGRSPPLTTRIHGRRSNQSPRP